MLQRLARANRVHALRVTATCAYARCAPAIAALPASHSYSHSSSIRRFAADATPAAPAATPATSATAPAATGAGADAPATKEEGEDAVAEYDPLEHDPKAIEVEVTAEEAEAEMAEFRERFDGEAVEKKEGEEAPKLTRSERRHAARKYREPSKDQIDAYEKKRDAVAKSALESGTWPPVETPLEEVEDLALADPAFEEDVETMAEEGDSGEMEVIEETDEMDAEKKKWLKETRELSAQLKEAEEEEDENLMHEGLMEFERIHDSQAEQMAELIAAREARIMKKLKKKEVDPIQAFFTSLKLADHAEKFDSMEKILRMKTRDLKEMGLTVRQRKQYLKLVDRYKMQMRANAALALIRSEGYSLTPAQLQARVYQIVYGHVYESIAVQEENARITAEWRQPIEEHREKRLEEHNNLRGTREPELMEMAKVEATQIAAAHEYIKSQLPSPEELAQIRLRNDQEARERGEREEGQEGENADDYDRDLVEAH